MHIVVIEDNLSLQKGIAYRLRDEGHLVDVIADGDAAADFLRQELCDVVLLDVNLPGQSGLDILRDLRARDDPRPVILLTARSSTDDRVEGLDLGADDYLVKPFAMDELMARLRALARRKSVAPRTSLALGPLNLQLDPPQLFNGDSVLDIPRRELGMLVALAQANGAPLSKEQLLDRVYGIGSDTDDKVVEVYISRLRKRLTPHGVLISVKRGIGYVLSMRI